MCGAAFYWTLLIVVLIGIGMVIGIFCFQKSGPDESGDDAGPDVELGKAKAAASPADAQA